MTIVSDVNNGTVTFSVNNTVLKATADFGPTIFITGNREREGGREGGREEGGKGQWI